MIMDFYDYFLSLLQAIFEIRDGRILGKLDIQKTFYFAGELGLNVPFNFRWGKLGPYSYELSNVMNRVSNQGIAPYTGEYRYNERNFRDVTEINISPEVQRFFIDIENLVERNGYDWINFIEALASIHFLYKYSNIKERNRIFKRLRELKSERMDFLEELLEPAWEFLDNHELINAHHAGVGYVL